jgi:hypothetical protein
LKQIYIITASILVFVIVGCEKEKIQNITISSSKDSLSDYFKMANDLSLPVGKRTENIEKLKAIVLDQDNDSLNRVNLFKVANRYYNIGNWNQQDSPTCFRKF